MIRRNITISLVALLCFCASQALSQQAQAPATPSAPDAKELTQLLNNFLSGASRNDAAIHDRFWAHDLIYTSATGTRRGKAELMAGVRSAPPQTAPPATIYSAEDVRIQQYGDTAIVAFRLVATPATATSAPSGAAPGTSAPAVQRFFNTGTFLRRNGEWRAVAWQATRIPE